MIVRHLVPTSFLTFLYSTVTLGMFIDRFASEYCTSGTGSPGKCVRLNECASAKRMYSTLCEFDYYEVMVCCEYEDDIIASVKDLARDPDYGKIAKQKCLEYTEFSLNAITECLEYTEYSENAITVFILDGDDAAPQEFPHMALLGFGAEDDIDWKCGGTLVSEKFILTAAHCLRYSKDTAIYAQLGTTHIKGLEHGGVRIKVRNRFPHPDYTPTQRYNDIALVELEKEVVFHTLVKPACLQVEKKINIPELIATGWGASEDGGELSPTLQKVSLVYVPYNVCVRSYQPELKLEEGLRDEQQFCASTIYGGDTCQGDSGGPLQYKPEASELYIVAGITSFGAKCGLLPAVYTRVSHYITWIESIVWLQ